MEDVRDDTGAKTSVSVALPKEALCTSPLLLVETALAGLGRTPRLIWRLAPAMPTSGSGGEMEIV